MIDAEEAVMEVLDEISLSVVPAAVEGETAGGKVTVDERVGTSTVM